MKVENLISKFPILPFLVCLALLFYMSPVFADTNFETLLKKGDLESKRLEKERKSLVELLNELRDKEGSVLTSVQQLSDNIGEIKKRVKLLQKDIESVNHLIGVETPKIFILEQQIEVDQQKISDQIRSYLVLKRIKHLTKFPGLNSFKDYFRNQHLLTRITELDAMSVERLQKNLSILKQKISKQEKRKSEIDHLQAQETEENSNLVFEQNQLLTYLRQIRLDQELRLRYLGEIQAEKEKMNDLIYSLKERKNNSSGFKHNGFNHRQKMNSPVTGKLLFSFETQGSPFYLLYNRGIIVETKAKALIENIWPGKVVFTGSLVGFNNVVIVDHGKENFTVYGNIQTVFVSLYENVELNTSLGRVAYNNQFEKYLFYFETRVKKKAVDPLRWIHKPQ